MLASRTKQAHEYIRGGKHFLFLDSVVESYHTLIQRMLTVNSVLGFLFLTERQESIVQMDKPLGTFLRAVSVQP